MNAVEKFDFSRGVRFSTYATWAVVKRFASLKRKQSRQLATIDAQNPWLEVTADLRLVPSTVPQIDAARQSLDDVMDETLEERERFIVRAHYGLTDKTETGRYPQAQQFTPDCRSICSMSKERIRQLEMAALAKLRRVLTSGTIRYYRRSVTPTKVDLFQ